VIRLSTTKAPMEVATKPAFTFPSRSTAAKTRSVILSQWNPLIDP